MIYVSDDIASSFITKLKKQHTEVETLRYTKANSIGTILSLKPKDTLIVNDASTLFKHTRDIINYTHLALKREIVIYFARDKKNIYGEDSLTYKKPHEKTQEIIQQLNTFARALGEHRYDRDMVVAKLDHAEQTIRRRVDEGESLLSIAHDLDVPSQDFIAWVNIRLSISSKRGASQRQLDAAQSDIITMLKEGVPRNEIADHFNVNYNALYRWLVEKDLSDKYMSRNDQQYQLVLAQYDNIRNDIKKGKSMKEMSEKYAIPYSTLQKHVNTHLSKDWKNRILAKEVKQLEKLVNNGASRKTMMATLHWTKEKLSQALEQYFP